MYNEHEELMKEAPPSTAVLVNGWKDTPEAGDEVLQVKSEVKYNILCLLMSDMQNQ